MASLREAVTSSKVFPRHDVMPMPVTTTLRSFIDRAERAVLPARKGLTFASREEAEVVGSFTEAGEREKEAAREAERTTRSDLSIVEQRSFYCSCRVTRRQLPGPGLEVSLGTVGSGFENKSLANRVLPIAKLVSAQLRWS